MLVKSKRRRKKRLNLFRLIIFIFFLAALTGTVLAIGLVVVSIKDLPAWNESELLAAGSTQIFDRNGELITKIGVENRVSVPLREIPEHVQEAFLAAEDHRFYSHHGVRLDAILRAVWNDLLHRELAQGGSTITQQLARVSFLSQEKTFKRKIQEIILAIQLERHYSKQEILEFYLNKIYLGEGAYGVQAAAQVYFGKNVGELSLSEGAMLAGITRAPSIYSPYQNFEAALELRNSVLESMARYNYISEAEMKAAKAEPLVLKKGKPGEQEYPCAYFVDYVTEELIDRYGEDRVFKGGLRVFTTLDREIQTIAERVMADPENFPPSQRDASGTIQPQGAVVVLDPSNGEIRAVVGGREHLYRRCFNRATTPPGRQPGSAFKPIAVYAPAIELRGMGPASVIDDAPVRYKKYGGYQPRNYDGTYRGLITMRTALTHSVNVAAVKVLMDHVGIPDAISFASRLGISLDPSKNGPAMALGGINPGVTPLQMAAAYAAFANDGIYNEPVAILRVESPDGTVLEEHKPQPRKAMKETTAYLITSMLQSVIQNGTGTRANIGRPAAGKTGTTDKGADIWFCGYTPDLVAVVWIGYDKPTRMPWSGGSYPALIWRKIMSEALADTPARDFKRPRGIVSATVDSKSGLLPGPNTPPEHMVTDLFAAGTVPKAIDNVHVLVEICATSGKLANEYCPERLSKIMIKLPYTVPEYVADYSLRMPTETCDLHGPESQNDTQPVFPDIPDQAENIPETEEPGNGETGAGNSGNEINPEPPEKGEKTTQKPYLKPDNPNNNKKFNIFPIQ